MNLPKLGITVPGLLLLLPVLYIPASAHGGGLDAHGCHHDRKRGGYHCHRGPFAGQAFASKDAMLQQPRESSPPQSRTPPSTQASPQVLVVSVIDGDTIEVCCVGGRREKVRYIGVNTPETKHPTKGVERMGNEAAEVNRKLVAGKTIRLELDVEQRDKYGRLLAYIYLDDGTLVNAWLVQNGYAQVMTIPPNVKYQELLLRLQGEAREAQRGLWRQ